MAAHRARTPCSVFEVLFPQCPERAAGAVPDPDLTVEEDASAERTLPAVQLGVLVVSEALVVTANASEKVEPKRGVVPVIHEPARAPSAVSRAAGSEWRVREPGNC